MTNKIKLQKELADIIKARKADGKKIGFTNGCFDILHAGHVRYLSEAKKNCDFLIVAVNSDSSVKKIKGNSRPINGQNARMEVLAALESVDFIVLFEEETPENLIRIITPDILFKGGDWAEENVVGGDYVRSKGGNVKLISYAEGFSTTGIIEKLKK
ncbi:MAG: D-glycero-beta-D-manno-heptose 1-phosphate adenylyltransferase [Candidatus Omnitrophota bacterium]